MVVPEMHRKPEISKLSMMVCKDKTLSNIYKVDIVWRTEQIIGHINSTVKSCCHINILKIMRGAFPI